MREPSIVAEKERGATGVIDTLSAGYGVVNRHPWLLVIPLLLDFFFWLGPRLSLAPLLQRTIDRLPAAANLSGEVLESYQQYRESLLQAGEAFNLFALLVTHFPGLPSLMAGGGGTGPVIGLDDGLVILGLSLLLPVLGIGLAALYYLSIGRQVVTGENRGGIVEGAWKTWGRLLAFVAMALGAFLIAAVPVTLGMVLAGSASSSLAGFLMSFLWVALVWIQFYLFFLVDAMVISDVGPLRAMRNSVAVVRYNLGPSLRLIALIWIITLGMPVVWSTLAENPLGVVPSILGNAYIAAGLAAASMIYYRDRFAAIVEKTTSKE